MPEREHWSEARIDLFSNRFSLLSFGDNTPYQWYQWGCSESSKIQGLHFTLYSYASRRRSASHLVVGESHQLTSADQQTHCTHDLIASVSNYQNHSYITEIHPIYWTDMDCYSPSKTSKKIEVNYIQLFIYPPTLHSTMRIRGTSTHRTVTSSTSPSPDSGSNSGCATDSAMAKKETMGTETWNKCCKEKIKP